MVAFGIFWFSVLALFFFLLAMIFKSLAAAFVGLIDSMITTLIIVFWGGLSAIILYIIFMIAEGIRKEGIGAVILAIILLIILLSIIFALIGWLGLAFVDIALSVLVITMKATSTVLETGSNYSERAYYFFLQKVVNLLGKC